mmetsp:Transcript_48842/g.106405  ORF Transcript_48842/g.106405 Transcript_48842/m.106405 type:complete len:285 (+) Transcript_48842:448-1302(+)
MDHNEVHKGDHLTHVGHSPADVNSTESLWNAFEHVQRCSEGALFAFVDIHRFVDGNAQIGNVGGHHSHIHTALHAISHGALANQQPSVGGFRLISKDTDLASAQGWRSWSAGGRTQGSASSNLSHGRDQSGDSSRTDCVHIGAKSTVGCRQGQFRGQIAHPRHQDRSIHLAGQLRLAIPWRRTGANDGVQVVSHAHGGDESFQDIEGTFRIGSNPGLLAAAELLQSFDGGQGIQLSNVVLLPLLAQILTSLHHGFHHRVVRHTLVLVHLQELGGSRLDSTIHLH